MNILGIQIPKQIDDVIKKLTLPFFELKMSFKNVESIISMEISNFIWKSHAS